MPKALIVYASWTGNSEEIANILGRELKKLNVEVEILECQMLFASEYLKNDICVVSTYTFGSQGDLPEEIEDFYFDLEEVDLKGKIYGTLGSGEEFYGYFCKSVDDFDEMFQKTGAIRGAGPLKIEANPNEEDEKRIAIFARQLVKKYKEMQTAKENA